MHWKFILLAGKTIDQRTNYFFIFLNQECEQPYAIRNYSRSGSITQINKIKTTTISYLGNLKEYWINKTIGEGE